MKISKFGAGWALLLMSAAHAALAEEQALQAQYPQYHHVKATTHSPYQAIGQLGIIDVNGVFRGFCTGSLIAPDTVLTAAHCITSRETESLVFIPEKNGDPYSATGPRGTLWVDHGFFLKDYLSPTEKKPTDSKKDLGVLKLAKSTRIPPLTVAPIDDENRANALCFAGYPGDKNSELWESCGRVRVLSQAFKKAMPEMSSEDLLSLVARIVEGQSGSAVRDIGNKIVGVAIQGPPGFSEIHPEYFPATILTLNQKWLSQIADWTEERPDSGTIRREFGHTLKAGDTLQIKYRPDETVRNAPILVRWPEKESRSMGLRLRIVSQFDGPVMNQEGFTLTLPESIRSGALLLVEFKVEHVSHWYRSPTVNVTYQIQKLK